jgi:hypothetical protein
LERTVKKIAAVKIQNPEIRGDVIVQEPAFPPLKALPIGLVDNCRIRMGSWTPMFPAAAEK